MNAPLLPRGLHRFATGRRTLAGALFLLAAARSLSAAEKCATCEEAAPVEIGSRLELFVDDYLIDTMKDVRLKLHEPRSMGTAMVFDKPWEGVTSGYVSVFKDG
ncbi:MAG: hypothetical protein JWM88_79, partial [Verrucomicrobia bacterium]|nr:hypothetical protein [Verrucomicrobiota bacterium]